MFPGISFLQEVNALRALTKNSLSWTGPVLTEVVVTGQHCAGHMLMLLKVSDPPAFQKWIGRAGGSGGESNQSTGKSWPKKVLKRKGSERLQTI